MQVVLKNVQKKHLKLIAELAKNLNFCIVSMDEDDSYLNAINEVEISPFLSKEEKIAFLNSVNDKEKASYKIAGKAVKAIKKPSDFFGTISEKEGEKMHLHLAESRGEWERNI